jgi:beta-glucosidase
LSGKVNPSGIPATPLPAKYEDESSVKTFPRKQVVQLYITAPGGKPDKPVTALAFFYTASTAWIAEAGNYTVKIGASSSDTLQTTVFTLAKRYRDRKM